VSTENNKGENSSSHKNSRHNGSSRKREPYQFIPVETPEEIRRDLDEIRMPSSGGDEGRGTGAAGGTGQEGGAVTTPRFEKIADIMKEFHRGTWWESRNGQMAELAIEDTHAKITNYYVIHDRVWDHGAVVDFIDMDEGTGKYTVYALCTDGTVLAVPEEELDEPMTVTWEGQSFQSVRRLPREVEDTADLGRRILAEKDRLWDAYEKQKDIN